MPKECFSLTAKFSHQDKHVEEDVQSSTDSRLRNKEKPFYVFWFKKYPLIF